MTMLKFPSYNCTSTLTLHQDTTLQLYFWYPLRIPSTKMHILQASIDLEFYASNTIPTRWEEGNRGAEHSKTPNGNFQKVE